MIDHLRHCLQKTLRWLCRTEHKDKARQIRQDVEKAFTQHPHETGESYVQHLWFTIRLSLRLVAVSALLLTHGVFPFLFTRTASREIERIYQIMKSRIPRSRLQELNEGEEN